MSDRAHSQDLRELGQILLASRICYSSIARILHLRQLSNITIYVYTNFIRFYTYACQFTKFKFDSRCTMSLFKCLTLYICVYTAAHDAHVYPKTMNELQTAPY